MSGHNKWSKVKHQKARTDAVKNRAFSKASLAIMSAVKEGGDNADLNARLRMAIEEAKKANMPKDNIKRAIERAAGKGDGAKIEEVAYEGYAPGGIALYIESLTDNRNRTSSLVRSVLEKNGGSLGAPGSVAYMFNKKGYLEFDAAKVTEDRLMEILLEAGVEDIKDSGSGTYEVYCQKEDFDKCVKAAEAAGVEIAKAELSMVPTNIVTLDEEKATKVLELIEKLEEIDDIQNVFANFDIPDEILNKLA